MNADPAPGAASDDGRGPAPAGDRQWLSGLFEEIEDCLYLKDRDGRYVDANAAAARVFGCAEVELLGLTDSDLFPASVADAIRVADRRVLAGEAVRLREELPHAVGGTHLFLTRKLPWVDGDGQVVGVAGISTDVTDTARTQRELSDSVQRLRTLFEEAPIGKAVIGLDGAWLQVNPALARLTGYPADDLIAGRAADVVHPDDAVVDLAHQRELLEQRRRTYEIDKRYIRADGNIVWVNETVTLVRDDDGSPRYFIHQIRDITEQLAARDQLELALATSEQANAELRRADEIRDHLLSVTSHELRTPLTTVRGYAQMLSERYDDMTDEDRRVALISIDRQARRLDLIIVDLLTLSELRAGALQPRLEEVNVASAFRRVANRYPEVEIADAGDLAVRADPEWLSEMVLRLVDNAERHGALPVTVTAHRADGGCEIRVEDAGPGVPAEFVPRLFEDFTQSDSGLRRRTSGVGAGLAVVAEMVSAMGGDIS
ncbi:MAG: PAS domain S-box protein, partial [Frankiaceae bacterium]|nr:PAS domain S-box protein [Frankiaceae bacterium]